ncbi:GIY-YIG nuclease family protein, partial [Candidatus Daviesbacteria bacterium]|nr:GIY-YIG nuclease family protein [Candidatus Daviesbacteria bacterium]
MDKTKIPHKPGVYIYKDQAGKILYVGKAIDLYHRVSSYFSASHTESGKLTSLVREIRDIETIIVESELEALILEANLIKKYSPPFNIR